MLNAPEDANFMGMPPMQNNAQLNFQKKADKDFIDNSNNKITYNSTITSNQLIQTKKDQYEVKMLNLILEHKFTIEEKKERLKNNLINPNRSEIDKTNIIRDLKYFAKIPVDIDEDNYLLYGMLFLQKMILMLNYLKIKK